MSGSWVEGFNAALLAFLNKELSWRNAHQAREITYYSQDNNPGGCDTCGPDITVDFYYVCDNEECSVRHFYGYWGSFASVIQEITS